MRIFMVWEQWPLHQVACFWTLEDAQNFVRNEGQRYALPVITSTLYWKYGGQLNVQHEGRMERWTK